MGNVVNFQNCKKPTGIHMLLSIVSLKIAAILLDGADYQSWLQTVNSFWWESSYVLCILLNQWIHLTTENKLINFVSFEGHSSLSRDVQSSINTGLGKYLIFIKFWPPFTVYIYRILQFLVFRMFCSNLKYQHYLRLL